MVCVYREIKIQCNVEQKDFSYPSSTAADRDKGKRVNKELIRCPHTVD